MGLVKGVTEIPFSSTFIFPFTHHYCRNTFICVSSPLYVVSVQIHHPNTNFINKRKCKKGSKSSNLDMVKILFFFFTWGVCCYLHFVNGQKSDTLFPPDSRTNERTFHPENWLQRKWTVSDSSVLLWPPSRFTHGNTKTRTNEPLVTRKHRRSPPSSPSPSRGGQKLGE